MAVNLADNPEVKLAKLASIEKLYIALYNTDLDVEDFAKDFYFAVGSILLQNKVPAMDIEGYEVPAEIEVPVAGMEYDEKTPDGHEQEGSSGQDLLDQLTEGKVNDND